MGKVHSMYGSSRLSSPTQSLWRSMPGMQRASCVVTVSLTTCGDIEEFEKGQATFPECQEPFRGAWRAVTLYLSFLLPFLLPGQDKSAPSMPDCPRSVRE